jgi:hypothetical protein
VDVLGSSDELRSAIEVALDDVEKRIAVVHEEPFYIAAAFRSRTHLHGSEIQPNHAAYT